MKVSLWYIGKNKQHFVEDGVSYYINKIKHYCKFELKLFPKAKLGKHAKPAEHKKADAVNVLAKLQASDVLILLDEGGKVYNSIEFAKWLEQKQVYAQGNIIFLVGGAYGFDQSLYDRANGKVSLSKMTFSHQMIRISFLEQLYRAYTIINNEKYHNE